MKRKAIALTSIVLSLTFVTVIVSCNNDDDNNSSNNDTPQTSGNVYIAGNNGETAVLWSNGEATTFPYETAYGVAVSGNEVYVVGSRDNQYCYWKAGQPETPTILEGQTTGSSPLLPPYAVSSKGAIAVSGSDVYAGSTPSGYYWKDGQRVSLPDGGYVAGITVSGNDVYMAGYDNNGAEAVYWKNGQKVVLAGNTNALTGCVATGIAVSGNDVYACGSLSNPYVDTNVPEYCTAVYWKNGQRITLSSQSVAYTTGIAVHGSDVYVCGNLLPTTNMMQTAVYWKNGQQITLAQNDITTGINAVTTGIAVFGNDVYVCGTISNSDGSTAVYWKNGRKVELGTGAANAITIQQ